MLDTFYTGCQYDTPAQVAYLKYLKLGGKSDTKSSLRHSPLYHSALFSDSVITKAEEHNAKSDTDAHPPKFGLSCWQG